MATPTRVAGRDESRRTSIMFVALVLTFLPLAFSDDLVEAATEDTDVSFAVLIPTDVVVLAALYAVSRIVNGRSRTRDSRLWWVAAVALTIALDAYLLFGAHTTSIDVALATGYALTQSLALGAVVQASPTLFLSGRLRASRGAEWRRLRGGVPILLGTFAAYLGGVYWDHVLNPDAIRGWGAASERAAALPVGARFPGVVASLCGGAVDQEYFAQVSQIIPLLLIAIGVDAKFFQRFKDPAERAMTIVAVTALCLAEAIAISTLPTPNDECDAVLNEWHEYVAFSTTIAACAIALATLAWALLLRDKTGNRPPRRAAHRDLTIHR